MKQISLAILYGGVSHEHEISLLSAQRVLKELNCKDYTIIPIFISKSGKWYLQTILEDSLLPVVEEERSLLSLIPGSGVYLKEVYVPIDIAIPLTHGKGGEDGTLQGLLELIHISYIGPSPYSSMVGMHKKIAKMIAFDASIPIVPYMSFSFYDIDMLVTHDTLSKHIAQKLGYDEYRVNSKSDLYECITSQLGHNLIIKAEDEGSSVGIEVFLHEGEEVFYNTLMKVFAYSSHLLVEVLISDMVEVECGVVMSDKIIASNPKVIANPKTENPHFLSYKQKYFSDTPFSIDTTFHLPPFISSLIKEYSIHMSEAISLEGFARVDFFYQREGNRVYFNEINTIPGLTTTSIYPLLMKEIGLPLGDLISLLIAHKMKER